MAQPWDGRVESREGMGAPLRPTDSGSDLGIAPFVGTTLELMSPALGFVPGGPRLFVSGEFLPSFSASRDPGKEGDPSQVSFRNAPELSGEDSANGVGSRTTAAYGDYAWGADVGIAFPLQLEDRSLRIRLSAGWLRYGVDLEGHVVAARKDDPPMVPPFGSNVREIDLFETDRLTLDALGPGLEVEMDASRYGPFGITLFAGAHAYRVLGERKAAFSRQVGLSGDGLPPETYRATWSFEVERWLYRAGLGIRFRWLGD